MCAQRIILETDAAGELHGLPKLPPGRRVEVVFRVLERALDESPRPRRLPPARLQSALPLAGPDSAVDAAQWEASLERTARQIEGDPAAFGSSGTGTGDDVTAAR